MVILVVFLVVLGVVFFSTGTSSGFATASTGANAGGGIIGICTSGDAQCGNASQFGVFHGGKAPRCTIRNVDRSHRAALLAVQDDLGYGDLKILNPKSKI